MNWISKAIKQTMLVEKAQSNLFKLVVKHKDPLIEKALDYFRERYVERPEKYPGDHVLYDLFGRFILKGLTAEESYQCTLDVINREMKQLDYYRALQFRYTEDWH